MGRAVAGRAAEYFDAGLRRVEVFCRNNKVQAAYFPTIAMCRYVCALLIGWVACASPDITLLLS